MVNVSKNSLKPKVAQDVVGKFIATMADLDKGSAEIFYKEFFTKAEQLLFAKRFAIVYLLREGWSPYRIAVLLKVSKATVYALNERFTSVEREALITSCERFNTQGGLLKELKALLEDGMSMDPKKRVKWLNEFESRYEQ